MIEPRRSRSRSPRPHRPPARSPRTPRPPRKRSPFRCAANAAPVSRSFSPMAAGANGWLLTVTVLASWFGVVAGGQRVDVDRAHCLSAVPAVHHGTGTARVLHSDRGCLGTGADRAPESLLALLVDLKCFQKMARFCSREETPRPSPITCGTASDWPRRPNPITGPRTGRAGGHRRHGAVPALACRTGRQPSKAWPGRRSSREAGNCRRIGAHRGKMVAVSVSSPRCEARARLTDSRAAGVLYWFRRSSSHQTQIPISEITLDRRSR